MKYNILLLLTVFLLIANVSANPYSANINQDTSTNVNFYTGNLTNISQMQDVNIPSPADDEILTYDSGTSKWIAQPIGMLTRWIINTANGFFYTSSNTLYFNDTLLENTIDDRAVTTEVDPIWTSDKTNYSTTAEIIAFGYYNSTNFIITDYFKIGRAHV